MDISDEIAYAVHDLDDALKLKYFTIDDLQYEFSISDDFKHVVDIFNDIVISAKKFAEKADSYKTSEEYSMLFRKELTSLLVNLFVNDIGLTTNEKLGYMKYELLARGLKKLTFGAINRQPDIIEYELLGKHILNSLYKLYNDQSYNKGLVLLPGNYRITENWERMVLDYLGGMTDIFAINQYEKYFGKLHGKGLFFSPTYSSAKK